MEKASRPKNHEKTLEQLREHTEDKEEKQTEDSLCLQGIGGQLRAAAKLGYPNTEDAEDPMIAPQDYDVRQFARVLELKTETNGYDQQICPGTFPSSRPFVKNLLRTIVQCHPRKYYQGGHGSQEAEDSQKR